MADSSIYTGVWVNWSKGAIAGATLTTSASHGKYLLAFLALFVGMVGSHMWGITCFCLHQFMSKNEPRDGLHHQLRLLLRSSQTVQGTL
jgi:hypothetical protein